MFEPKEVNLDAKALSHLLEALYKSSQRNGTDLEVLGLMLAVIIKGYHASLGAEQAAMLFYSVADELATANEHDGESDSDFGDKQ
jgi:hypothetical protein